MSSATLRITHILPQLGIGGAEIQLHRLITASAGDPVRHEILHYSEPIDPEAERLFGASGVSLRRIPRRGRFDPAFLPRLTRELARSRPDIVHCWLVSACLWGRAAALAAGLPRVILSFRGTEIELRSALRLSRLFGERQVTYLANSRAVAGAIARNLAVSPDRVVVIPNGIEPGGERTQDARRSLLEACGCPPASRLVLAVGRLTPEKDYPMLLRVASRFPPEEGVRFIIAGHGEMETSLRALATRLGVADRVHFLGLRRDVPVLLRGADAFCFTSRVEGAPNALLEAMATGLPIVTTRFDGLSEILVDGVEALSVGVDDDAAAAASLRRLLADADEACRIGAAARAGVASRCSTAAMVAATLDLYRRIAADGRAASATAG